MSKQGYTPINRSSNLIHNIEDSLGHIPGRLYDIIDGNHTGFNILNLSLGNPSSTTSATPSTATTATSESNINSTSIMKKHPDIVMADPGADTGNDIQHLYYTQGSNVGDNKGSHIHHDEVEL